jgi:SAM-dependent methyltransferase
VLDVGCGFGRDVAEFRQRGADAYGCDGSEVLLADARAEVGDFFKLCDVLREPLPWGGEFDLVWSCMLLVHVPRDRMGSVMAKMWQCLRPGGQLLLNTKWGEGEHVAHNLGADKPRLMVYYREEELAAEVARLGGEVVRLDLGATLATGDRVMELVARKP